ncbi:hypothetical protein V0242_24780 (plasmid) [Aeromonas hydrophila]|uniref:hypothetical protein n=1 Tax=Aeromonas hydrophila TaxID=644 RepID=UPI002ED5A061|nr:hypothetical protein V0242_24780 [Aeromonas hydrophila]
MNIFEFINFLSMIPALILSMAIIIGMGYGLNFLRKLRFAGSSQARGQVVSGIELFWLGIAMVVMIQFPDFIQDSVMTMTGTALEPVNPLSWDKIGQTDDSEVLVATLFYRFFQVYGLVTLFNFGTSLAAMGDPQQRGKVTAGGLAVRFVAGVMLMMPTATAEGVGLLFPLVGAFGDWMSQNRL